MRRRPSSPSRRQFAAFHRGSAVLQQLVLCPCVMAYSCNPYGQSLLQLQANCRDCLPFTAVLPPCSLDGLDEEGRTAVYIAAEARRYQNKVSRTLDTNLSLPSPCPLTAAFPLTSLCLPLDLSLLPSPDLSLPSLDLSLPSID